MAVFKCKMCGGDLDIKEGLNVCECEYCGTKQTIPALDNEKKLNLFNRANRLRLNSEFDKAATIYENIIAEFPEEAEGYWGLVLCNYGIEYVDDPATAKKIPTCHRAAFDSVTKDENYQLALEYADATAQKLYRDEAREIDRIMSEILSISKNEKPYDIFICYKETDETGNRTIDSVIAQDVYDALTDKGYRVFFSRISLEDKIGQMYEPYIFAALNSAKVMLSFGTKYEYFQAVWVKNEWSRFLKLMAKDKSKILVPCYKDIDPYDMPDEFKALQAQDMGKVGAIQDLVRGMDKIFARKKEAEVKAAPVDNSLQTAAKHIKLAKVSLEAHKWSEALLYLRNAMKSNPDYPEIYLYSLLAKNKIESVEKLANRKKVIFDKDGDYIRYVKLSGGNPEVKIADKMFGKKWKYGLATAFGIIGLLPSFALVAALSIYKIISVLNYHPYDSAFTQTAFGMTLPVVLVCFISLIVALVLVAKKRRITVPGIALLLSCFTFFLSFFVFVNAETNWAFDIISKKSAKLCEAGNYEEAVDLYFVKTDDEKYKEYAWDTTIVYSFDVVGFTDVWLGEDIANHEKEAQEVLSKAAQEYVNKDDYKGMVRFFVKKFDAYTRVGVSEIVKLNVPEEDYDLYAEAIAYYTDVVVSKLQESSSWDTYSAYSGYGYDLQVRYNLIHQLPEGAVNTKVIDALYKFLIETDYSERDLSALEKYYNNQEVKKLLLSDDYIAEFMLGEWSNGSKYIEFYEKNDSVSCRNNLPTPNVYDVEYYDIVDGVYIWKNDESQKVADVFKFTFVDKDTLKCYCYSNGETYTLYR